MDNVVNEALGITKKQLHKQAVKTIKDPVKAGDNVVAQKPYGMPVYDKMVIDLEQFLAHLYTKHLNARISETSKLEIKKIIDEEIANIKQHILDEDLNFSRSKMPQVDTQNLSKAMDMVSDKAKITKGTISAGKLKKSQKELHQDKVEGIAKKFTSPDKFKPLVISKDNHIVDGHHRWGAAIYKWGEDVKIPIIRINLPILQAIKLYKEIALKLNQPVKETIKKVGDKYAVYPKRGGDRLGTHDTKSAAEKQLTAIEISKHKNEDINIPINIGDTILGGKFKNKRIVVKSIEKNEKGDITINGKPLMKFRLVSENVAPNHNGKSAPYGSGYKPEEINEIPMGDLEKIDTFADKQLNPLDIVLTGRHFFDRLNDPRNGKEISNAELIGFFKRLSKKKKEFVEFLQNYNTLVAADDKTNINIPFMKQSNKAIAKTIMRKKDFKTPDKKLDI